MGGHGERLPTRRISPPGSRREGKREKGIHVTYIVTPCHNACQLPSMETRKYLITLSIVVARRLLYSWSGGTQHERNDGP